MSNSALTVFVLRKVVEHRSTAAMKSLTCVLGILFGGLGNSARSRYRFHTISSSVRVGDPGVSVSSSSDGLSGVSSVPSIGPLSVGFSGEFGGEESERVGVWSSGSVSETWYCSDGLMVSSTLILMFSSVWVSICWELGFVPA